MIDKRRQVELLLTKLTEALPVRARLAPELVATQEGRFARALPDACPVTSVSYAGDQGGIMCELDLRPHSENAVYTSITHLRFDPRLPLTREIVSYQRYRTKRIEQA